MRLKIFLKIFLGFLLWPPLLLGQFTQVQGTITDPSGLPYANGTITPSLVISGTPRFSSSGFGYTPPNQPVGLDSKGSFVMQLADVTQLLPPGGTWSFHTCSAAGTVQPGSPVSAGPVCFDVTGIVVTGSVMDISAQLSAAAPKLTSGAGGAGGVSSVNGATGALSLPNMNCAGSTCTQTNPFLIGPPVVLPAGSLAGQGVGAIGVSTQTTSTVSPPSGTAWFWALNAGGPAYGWQPIPYLMVNGSNPSGQVSAQQLTDNFPAAPNNGLNVRWSRSLAANTFSQQISAALVGDGNQNHFFNGDGEFVSVLNGLSFANGTNISCSGGACAPITLSPFPGNSFTSTPSCVATPTTSGVNSMAAAATTTTLTITYSPATAETFSFICIGF